MRSLLALLAFLLLSGAAAPRDWTATVTRTPAGAYVLGNPQARVKLVEYASYTCPHCAAFARESDAVLKGRMIRSGSTSLEVRHFVRDRLDLAAAILARCTGPRGFFGASAAIYAAQEQWLARGMQFDQLNASQLALYSQADQLRAEAEGSGLTALVQARGLLPAATAACFDDDAATAQITAMTAAAPRDLPGTPTFFINGRIVPRTAAWAQLEPALRAAGAK
ncbi:thioredoxin domain-containing protein [Sphingomonas sp.]|uniref:thioredoxin domain-containing protein n=1 Tax=Sphingomonas sp. TaxID=28214 RepID=UPI0035BC2827